MPNWGVLQHSHQFDLMNCLLSTNNRIKIYQFISHDGMPSGGDCA